MSVDYTSDLKRIATPPHQLDDSHPLWNTAGISASSSEHDNQETNAWSSDYSNSEDDLTIHEENAVPVSDTSRVGEEQFRLPGARACLIKVLTFH